MAFTDPQVLIITVSTWAGGSLSIVGSSVLAYIVLQRPKVDTYHRILLGLCVADVIHSISWMLGPIALPRSTSNRITAIGNTESCTASGLLFQLGLSSYLYNGMLSVYYLLVIQFGVKEARMLVFEIVLHTFIWTFSLSTAIAGVPLKLYNELVLGTGCWVAEMPRYCNFLDDLECIRGVNSKFYGYLFGSLIMVMPFLVIFSNVMIFCVVRRTQKRSPGVGGEENKNAAKRTRKVASQSFLYVFAFLNCTVWTVVVRNLDAWDIANGENESDYFVIVLLSQLISPAQGVFNLFIYIRPRYLRLRERRKDLTRAQALGRALWGKTRNDSSPTRFSFNGSLPQSIDETRTGDKTRSCVTLDSSHMMRLEDDLQHHEPERMTLDNEPDRIDNIEFGSSPVVA